MQILPASVLYCRRWHLLREFEDANGTHWRVWDVTPTVHERISPSLQRSRTFKIPSNWLCFDSSDERRRLMPIPAGWESASRSELQRLLGLAERATRRSDSPR